MRRLQSRDTADPRSLELYLRELEREHIELVAEVRAIKSGGGVGRLTATDLQTIKRALESGGVAELSLADLTGLSAEPGDARLPRLTAAPDPYTTPYDTYVLVGPPDTIWQIDRTVNPPVATQIATTPTNMLTTDTNQTPGATVVKTWTAQQVFNGGIDFNGSSVADLLNLAMTGAISGATDGTFTGTVATGALTATGNSSLVDLLVAGALTLRSALNIQSAALVSVTTTPYDVGANVVLMYVDTTGAARTVRLPATPTLGRFVILIDDDGNAAANNITLSGNGNNVNGAASVVIAANYGWAIAFYNGTQWNALVR